LSLAEHFHFLIRVEATTLLRELALVLSRLEALGNRHMDRCLSPLSGRLGRREMVILYECADVAA
jgi:hypothetical protein